MNAIPTYRVNAFSSETAQGNPCAVCIYTEWPDDNVLQAIAIENGLAETVFVKINETGNPELRWFTVSQEVEFCGYGTLSAAYAYLNHVNSNQDCVTFSIRNKKFKEISVQKHQGLFKMSVPAQPPLMEVFDEAVCRALGGTKPKTMYTTDRGDLLIVYDDKSLNELKPNYQALVECGYYGYILTAPSDRSDYQTIYVSPRMTDVWVDPANGASQATLAVYWQATLNKNDLHGVSATTTGGDFYCQYEPQSSQVYIGGRVTPT